jgi:hypothetical protein
MHRMTAEDASAFVEREAAKYAQKSYEQLCDLASTDEGHWSEIDGDFSGVPFCLTVQVHRWGLLRRRVSVEIVASAHDDATWPWTPCAYMERYANGHIRISTTRGMTSKVARRAQCLVHVAILVLVFVSIAVLLVSYRCTH